MKTKIFSAASLILLAFLFVSLSWNNGPTETICHNGNTIKVYKTSLNVHLAHGDTIGACD